MVFKRYDQRQASLLPPSYDDLVPERHPVRVVDEIVERIDIRALEAGYKAGGTSSYHPRMLLKVVIYAYLRNVYLSRKIEQALQENVHFMWLSGAAKPDHNTVKIFVFSDPDFAYSRSQIIFVKILPIAALTIFGCPNIQFSRIVELRGNRDCRQTNY